MPKTATPHQELPEACPKCITEEASVGSISKGRSKTRAAKAQAKKDAVQTGKDVWVECESCTTWYHWSCVNENPKDSLDTVDKWYCSPCLDSIPDLKITFRAPPRKSARNAGMPQINYSNLNQGIESDPGRWVKLLENSTNGRRNVVTTDQLPQSWKWEDGEGLEDWIWGRGFRGNANGDTKKVDKKEGSETESEDGKDDFDEDESGMSHPIVIRQGMKGVGMELPQNLTVREVAEIVGPDTPVEVIDVASQTGLKDWTVGRWAQYYNDSRPRDKIRNVISLEVSESKLGEKIEMPEPVRKLDWVTNFWPEDRRGPGQYPKVQKYCLMSVSHCWTDWHIDFAGSSVFYHILRGSKVFYFIRPTPENLKKYEKWSSSTEQQENSWLGGEVDKVYRLDLPQGSTAIIPTGWIHAVYTPTDSLVIGGNFLHSLNIGTQMRVYDIEVVTKVPKKFRFPQYERLCWYVALSYAARLRKRKETDPPAPLPADINVRVLKGLKHLARFLFEQVRRLDGKKATDVSANERRIARESVPHDKLEEETMSPADFVQHFKDLVVDALGDDDDGDDLEVDKRRRSASTVSAQKRQGSVVSEALSKKRRLSVIEDSAEGGRAKKKALKGKKASHEGEIISRETLPVQHTERVEMRVDPGRQDLGAREATVTTNITNNTVTKRFGLDEEGNTVLEKRTVMVTVEKTVWRNGMDVDIKPTAPQNGYHTDLHAQSTSSQPAQQNQNSTDIAVFLPSTNGHSGPSRIEDEIAAFLPATFPHPPNPSNGDIKTELEI
ncbi:Clavaminate synthase-like protein [Atractiella rhizophila]|nr:Clavaminate synthase-like protein [Atractiella rhizophila]